MTEVSEAGSSAPKNRYAEAKRHADWTIDQDWPSYSARGARSLEPSVRPSIQAAARPRLQGGSRGDAKARAVAVGHSQLRGA